MGGLERRRVQGSKPNAERHFGMLIDGLQLIIQCLQDTFLAYQTKNKKEV